MAYFIHQRFLQAILLVLIGCVLNNLVLELIIKEDWLPYASKTSGSLITFLQFFLITIFLVPSVCQTPWVWKDEAMNDTGTSSKGTSSKGTSSTATSSKGTSANGTPSKQIEKDPSGSATNQRFMWRSIFRPRTIPLYAYIGMAVLSGTASFLNNLVFAYNISQPTHMVFRSSGLVAVLVVGALLFHKKYTLRQTFAVFGVTLGAIVSTYAELTHGDTAIRAGNSHKLNSYDEISNQTDAFMLNQTQTRVSNGSMSCKHNDTGFGCYMSSFLVTNIWDNLSECFSTLYSTVMMQINSSSNDESSQYLQLWILGMLMLCMVVFLQAILGHIQGLVFQRFGKNTLETMFYMHLFPLLGYIWTLLPHLQPEIQIWNNSPPIQQTLNIWPIVWTYSPQYIANIPTLWLLGGCNVLSQYICIRGVFQLFANGDALTCTLIMTVRKCISLLLSVILFNNTFTMYHWTGALMVFCFAAYYSTLSQKTEKKQKTS